MDIKKLLIETICFEHWARFHFLEKQITSNQEDTEIYIVNIPEIVIEDCRAEVGYLVPLLEKMNYQMISLESSRELIFEFILQTVNIQAKEFAEELNKIVMDKSFVRFLDVFNTYVQEEADAEEELQEKGLENIHIPMYFPWLENFKLWAKERNLSDALEHFQ